MGAAVVIEDIVFVRTEVNSKSSTWLYFDLIQKFAVRKGKEDNTGVIYSVMI